MLWILPGKDVTIQCRPDTAKDILSLSVKMGLSENDVFLVEKDNNEPLIKGPFRERLQYSGNFPNLDILIKNLVLNDTGPYWCVYQRHNRIKRETLTVKGEGSVLLVVSGKPYRFSVIVAVDC